MLKLCKCDEYSNLNVREGMSPLGEQTLEEHLRNDPISTYSQQRLNPLI